LMPRRKWVWVAVGGAAVVASGYAAYRQYSRTRPIPAIELVSKLPPDATTVIYVDLAALRQSPLLAGLRAFAPSAQTEKEYADFVRDSGFDFERDLDRAAIALVDGSTARVAYALVEGRFDRERIPALALKSGKKQKQGGYEVFTTVVSGEERPVTFVFLNKGRIALTNGPDLEPMLAPSNKTPAREELAERVKRLAGSPVFFILRPSGAAVSGLATWPWLPRGIRSEQITALVAQLQWISIAARPDGERTKMVLEGESLSEDAMRQLASTLESLLLAARMALDDPKVRARMDPNEYAALADLLKTAEVMRLDRGETKSVRLILSVGPELLATLLRRPTQTPAEAPSEAHGKKTGAAGKRSKK